MSFKSESVKSWYESAFGHDYLRVYSHRDEREAREHVSLALDRLQWLPGERVLDLGCGSGRHALVLAERDLKVVGLDLSEVLLHRARQDALDREVRVDWLRADMFSLPFSDVFDVVFSFFTSFGYFETDEQNLRVLKNVHRSLKTGGRFWFDYLNIEQVLKNLVPRDEQRIDGLTVVQERWYNHETRRLEKKIVIQDELESREYLESVRAYHPFEIRELMRQAGFECRDVLGDYDGQVFHPDSPRLIMIGRSL
jgi:SAM-dependent methyltransferase